MEDQSTAPHVWRLHQSVAKTLLRCPIKAKADYERRFIDGGADDSSGAMIQGKVLERLITGTALDNIATIGADSYRTKAAQEARDDAKAAGLTPILAHKLEPLHKAAEAIRAQIIASYPEFAACEFFKPMQWESHGVHCEGELDALHMPEERREKFTVFDMKKARCADPKFIERSVILSYGYDIQRAAYTEAVNAHYPERKNRGRFVFLFFEIEAPYCVTPVTLDGGFMTVGDSKWRRAKAIWKDCLDTGVWPGYVRPGECATVECPAYAMDDTTYIDPPNDGADLDDIFGKDSK